MQGLAFSLTRLGASLILFLRGSDAFGMFNTLCDMLSLINKTWKPRHRLQQIHSSYVLRKSVKWEGLRVRRDQYKNEGTLGHNQVH